MQKINYEKNYIVMIKLNVDLYATMQNFAAILIYQKIVLKSQFALNKYLIYFD